MIEKFIFTRSYNFKLEKGRNMFFELVERHGNHASFRLRDKGNVEVIEATILVGKQSECCSFTCRDTKVVLWSDRFIPKGFSMPRGMTEVELKEWITTREDVLRDAHLYSSRHRAEVEAAPMCGCYCCQRIFSSAEIDGWTDNGATAICPYCDTDAIIPDVKGIVKVTTQLLNALNEKYF